MTSSLSSLVPFLSAAGAADRSAGGFAAADAVVAGSPAAGLIEMFQETGFVGPVLVLLFVVAMVMAARRWLALRSAVVAPEALQRSLEHALRAGQVDHAVGLAAGSPTPLGDFVASGLLLRADGLDEMLANTERAAVKESLLRQAGAIGIARLGTAILLLAVLGTVTGVMSTLAFLGAAKPPTLQDAAIGLRESLGATVFGLVFALACFAAYALLSSRAVRALLAVREIAEELVAEAARPRSA